MALGLLIIVGSVFRVLGFAPQIAMAVFAGAVIKDKKLAFIFPLFSMLLSDVIYQVLYMNGLVEYTGFYSGQVTNYILIMGLTFFGMLIKKWNLLRISAAVIAAPVTYFLLSNFLVWAGGGGYQRPKTVEGLMLCYNDALPFFRSSLETTAVFSILLFGGYYLINRYVLHQKQQLA
ncbi:MAG TPA: DUF6580 family putative transport protein [Chitinophagaceae bacterium]|nr:DUF6580 family putative transport protein [Chitinophagaceae bacterium]